MKKQNSTETVFWYIIFYLTKPTSYEMVFSLSYKLSKCTQKNSYEVYADPFPISNAYAVE